MTDRLTDNSHVLSGGRQPPSRLCACRVSTYSSCVCGACVRVYVCMCVLSSPWLGSEASSHAPPACCCPVVMPQALRQRNQPQQGGKFNFMDFFS
jgi:hypothetical protein